MNNIQAYTWLALSKLLLRNDPLTFDRVAPLYNSYLNGTNLVVPVVNETVVVVNTTSTTIPPVVPPPIEPAT